MDVKFSQPARSLGLKLILVGLLAFVLWVPALLIYALVWERSNRADEVRNEIYGLQGGRQTISGPIIIAPAIVDTGKVANDGVRVTRRTTVVFTPKELDVVAKVATETRRRSIYEATVYDADMSFTGRFAAFAAPKAADGAMEVMWDQAVVAVKFASDESLKGVRDKLIFAIDGLPVAAEFEPGIDPSFGAGETGDGAVWRSSGVTVALPLADRLDGFSFTLKMRLAGGGSLFFAPVGEETKVAMSSDWPHPSFTGAYLPDERAIDAVGFSASWSIPYLARTLPRSFTTEGDLSLLDAGKSFGVEFVSTMSPYQSVNRALKYALMFLGLVFLTFFLFEATMGARAHPAQYILLGFAQVIFYLLVLAFSEHIGFEQAFIGTAGATVLLSGFYAATVFRSAFRGFIALVAFSGAYGLIYLLMKSEDYALLIGSATAFFAIALTMFVTRNLDWYGGRDAERDR